MSNFIHFLLVYDHSNRSLIDTITFADGGEAVRAYRAKELEFENQKMIEVVLVGADSIETVRVTHANYFDCAVDNPYFAGIF